MEFDYIYGLARMRLTCPEQCDEGRCVDPEIINDICNDGFDVRQAMCDMAIEIQTTLNAYLDKYSNSERFRKQARACYERWYKFVCK